MHVQWKEKSDSVGLSYEPPWLIMTEFYLEWHDFYKGDQRLDIFYKL
jgi:hypothetical protein